MQRPPGGAKEPFISAFMLWRILFVEVLFITVALSMSYYALARGLPVEADHTLVLNVIVVLEIFSV